MKNRIPSDKPLSLAIDHNPPKEGPEIFILRLRGSERFSFTCLSELWGVWVHWSGQKSAPHYSDTKRCPGCRTQDPMRWKGFVHAFCVEKRQEVFLELTPASAHALNAQLATGELLRGQGIVVQRTKGDNGRLLVRVHSKCPDPDKLPPAKDPQESLMRLWGIQPQAPESGKEFPLSSNGWLDHAEKG